MYMPLCGEGLEGQSSPVPHRAPLSPKGPRQEKWDSGAAAAMWRGARTPIIPDSATQHPFLGCIRRCVRRSWKSKRAWYPGGASLSPKRRGVPIPQTAHAQPDGLRCFRRCVGRGWTVNHTRPHHMASLSQKRPRQDRRDSGVSAAMCGSVRSSIVPRLPTGRPYPLNGQGRPEGLRCLRSSLGRTGSALVHRPGPPNGPGRTGGTRVYLPLCGEGLEAQSYPTPPPRRRYPSNGPDGTGQTPVYPPLWGGGARRSIIADPPTGRPYPPNRPGRTEGVSGVSTAVWGGVEVLSYMPPPNRRPHHTYGPSRTGGTRVYQLLCGEELEVQMSIVPPRCARIAQTAQSGTEGLGCIRRCVGRGGSTLIRGPPTVRAHHPNNPGTTGGFGCSSRFVGRS